MHNMSEDSIEFRLFRPKLRFRTLYYFDFFEANDVYYFDHGRLQFYHINVPLSSQKF